MGILNRKGLVGLAAFGALTAILAFAAIISVLMAPANAISGNQVIVVNHVTSVNSPNTTFQINFTIANVNMTGNITNVSILLPAGMILVSNSNVTNITTHRTYFTNSTSSAKQYLNWSGDITRNTWELLNASLSSGVGYAKTFSFMASAPNWNGTYNFTVILVDNTTNTTTVSNQDIAVFYQTTPGKTDWTYCGPKSAAGTQVVGCIGPGINNTGGFFFWDKQNVTVALNFTSALSNSAKNS